MADLGRRSPSQTQELQVGSSTRVTSGGNTVPSDTDIQESVGYLREAGYQIPQITESVRARVEMAVK